MLSPKLVDILDRNKAAASRLVAVNNPNRVGKHAGVNNDGMVSRLRNAGKKRHDEFGVLLLHPGFEQLHGLGVGLGVAPDENIAQSRPAEDNRVVCSRQAGPSRYERRRQHQSSHAVPPRNLGVIEGDRLQRSRGYHEQATMAKNLASILAVASILYCAAIIIGFFQ